MLLARCLRPHARTLERAFEIRLRKRKLQVAVRRAIRSLMPTAAGAGAEEVGLFESYAEQAAYHGRRLAKLETPPELLVRLIEEYIGLVEKLLPAADPNCRESLPEKLALWRLWLIHALSQAYYEVAQAESATYRELFQVELESQSLEELLARMLAPLARFSRAEQAAVLLLDRDRRLWRLLHTLPHRTEVHTLPAGPHSVRRLRKPCCQLPGRRAAPVALLPEWDAPAGSCWSVPLFFGGRFSGVMQFGFSKHYPWLPRELKLLTAAANHCSLAADKACLVQRLAVQEEEIRRLAKSLVEVEERERKRISSELHDEAGQALMVLRLQLELLERTLPPQAAQLAGPLASLRQLTERTILEIRRVLSSLSPAVLSQLGLAAAVRQLAARLQEVSNLRVRCNIGSLPRLPAQIQTAIYRLLQECLNNAVRHSSASTVNISLKSADEHISIEVVDDGKGFDVEAALAKPGAFGLTGMKERVALLGGDLRIRSRPGKGTRIRVRLPVEMKQS
jgi:signal transduction histidine kinase